MNKKELYRLPDGAIAYLEMHSPAQIIADKGLDADGTVQAFHTQNVLRRIIKYMPMRSGMTIKVTVAQTDIHKPQIVTDTPYAQYLFNGLSKSGAPLDYTKTLNPAAGPHWDRALAAAELPAMAADLQRYINMGGKK